MSDNWYIIINPRAGSGKTMAEWMPAEKKLAKLRIPFTTTYTHHGRHAVELAKKAADDGFRKFLAVGGDGTLHETFRGIMLHCDEAGTKPEDFYLGVAPIGSGNDWIKSLKVPHDTEEVVNLINKASFGKMDIVKLYCDNGTVGYMANVGGVGFDAHVCERANAIKSLGWRNKMLYLRSLQYTIRHTSAIGLRVIADGKKVFEGQCYSIAMGNGNYSGGGMRQVPAAVVDDGEVDAMIVPQIPISTIVKEMPRLFSGTLMASDKVIFLRGKEIRIEPIDEKLDEIIEVDGEIEGRLPVTVKVTGGSINVIRLTN